MTVPMTYRYWHSFGYHQRIVTDQNILTILLSAQEELDAGIELGTGQVYDSDTGSYCALGLLAKHGLRCIEPAGGLCLPDCVAVPSHLVRSLRLRSSTGRFVGDKVSGCNQLWQLRDLLEYDNEDLAEFLNERGHDLFRSMEELDPWEKAAVSMQERWETPSLL